MYDSNDERYCAEDSGMMYMVALLKDAVLRQ